VRVLPGFSMALLVVAATPGAALGQLAATPFVTGLSAPVGMVQDPSNPTVQYVVELDGLIKVIRNGVLQATPFLDLVDEALSGGERGLLGLAFPDDYGSTGRFFVNFTREPDGHTVIARFLRGSTMPLRAAEGSRFDLVFPAGPNGPLRPFIAQPFANHNGGKLAFGPDGYLYIGLGDGGSGGDPGHRAQNPDTLLGKMLRIDVSVPDQHPRGYRVPADNPFLDDDPVDALEEIWAFGYRNPWRFSFDDPLLGGTGAMIVADVGQVSREEIDYEPRNAGGRNYGWSLFEGAEPLNDHRLPAYSPLGEPLHDYPRTFGNVVTGGYVYRGVNLGKQFRGRYFFADFGSSKVASLGLAIDVNGEATVTDVMEHTVALGNGAMAIASIDVDASGELYLVSITGTIYRVDAVPADSDGDTLPDFWEIEFGLNHASGSGVNGAGGDPDGDGATNAQELAAGSHPTATFVRYLAEGASGPFFDTEIALANPGAMPATAVVRLLKDDSTTASRVVEVPAGQQRVVDAERVPGAFPASFAAIVESNRALVVDRTMTWDDSAYGGHAESAVAQAGTTWYLAEGATHSGFELFYLLENPDAVQDSSVLITFLPAVGDAFDVPYKVPAGARLTVWVDTIQGIESAEVGAVIEVVAGAPVIVERAMYLTNGGRTFEAGHVARAVSAPASRWNFAEGATGPFFDLFLLLANPGLVEADVTVTFVLPNGQSYDKIYELPGESRRTVWVDVEPFDETPGLPLADTAVAMRVETSGVGVVAERAMWWPGPFAGTWAEAHSSAGATTTGPRWAFADGAVGGGRDAETYVLLVNTGMAQATVRVSLLLDGLSPLVSRTFDVEALSRFTVAVAAEFPSVRHRRFGALVEGLGTPAPLVVERSVYWNAGGMTWAAGTNVVATAW